MIAPEQVESIRQKAELLAGHPLGDRGTQLAALAAQRAMAYCQREDIPADMEQAVAALLLSLEDGGECVKSLQRGDTSITYAVGGPTSGMNALAPWRRLGTVKTDKSCGTRW